MLGWLPIIGPIIDGVFSIFRKQQDITLERIKQDTDVIKTQVQLVSDIKDDIGVRLARDLIMFPVAVWSAIATWDTIVAMRYPELKFVVASFPPGPLEYLPLAVLTFLFGMAWMKRR